AGRLATGGPARLRKLVGQMQLDAKTVARLEEAHLATSNLAKGRLDYAAANRAYQEAFEDYGLALETLAPGGGPGRMQGSAIAGQLVPGWANGATVKDQRGRGGGGALGGVARLAESAPWRQQLLDLLGRKDAAGLQRLAEKPGTARQQP